MIEELFETMHVTILRSIQIKLTKVEACTNKNLHMSKHNKITFLHIPY